MAEKSGLEALKTGSALLKKGTFAEKVEQWAVIKFCVDIGKTPTDTHKFLKQSEKHSKAGLTLEGDSGEEVALWLLTSLCTSAKREVEVAL
jgi:hypothetical protein